MRSILLILLSLAFGFVAGWFTGSRRTTRSHSLMGFQYTLQVHRALVTTNIAEVREATENYMSTLTMDAAAGSDVFQRFPALVPKLRTASTNFVDTAARDLMTPFLDEAEGTK
jgi:hypothetical protein